MEHSSNLKDDSAKVRNIYQKHSTWDENSKATKVNNFLPFWYWPQENVKHPSVLKGGQAKALNIRQNNIAQGRRGPTATNV